MIARNTAFTYKGKPIDVRQVGRDVGVRYVLEGSVRRTGDQVRVNVQLIDAESGAHLWADRFDTDRANLAEAQDTITGRLARTLNLELVEAAAHRIEQERAADPDARDLVMLGWAWIYSPHSSETRREARQAFERALETDPRSIDARIGLAQILVGNVADNWSSFVKQDEARDEQLLLEALERDANSSMAHRTMGLLRRVQNRLAEARVELETAIALDRNDAYAIRQLGMTLTFLGQSEAAIVHIEKAIQLSPHDPDIANAYSALGLGHLLLGHVDQAIDFLRKARVGNPRFWYIHLHLAGALGLRSDLEEARDALAESLKLKPQIDSLARLRLYRPWYTNPQFWRPAEKTLNAGLRRAGFPDQ